MTRGTLTAFRPATGLVGRPSASQGADWRDEATALKSELREVGRALPRARANYLYVVHNADSLEAEQNAAQIYYLVDRVSRRHR